MVFGVIFVRNMNVLQNKNILFDTPDFCLLFIALSALLFAIIKI